MQNILALRHDRVITGIDTSRVVNVSRLSCLQRDLANMLNSSPDPSPLPPAVDIPETSHGALTVGFIGSLICAMIFINLYNLFRSWCEAPSNNADIELGHTRARRALQLPPPPRRSGEKPLPRGVEEFVVVEIGARKGGREWDECVICLEDFVGGRGEARRPVILRCRHVYHAACIVEWLLRDRRCPICRENLICCSGAGEARRRWPPGKLKCPLENLMPRGSLTRGIVSHFNMFSDHVENGFKGLKSKNSLNYIQNLLISLIF